MMTVDVEMPIAWKPRELAYLTYVRESLIRGGQDFKEWSTSTDRRQDFCCQTCTDKAIKSGRLESI